jgi:predicted O-methyltransferase YrrM
MLSKIKTVFWYLKQPKGTLLLKNLILQKTTYLKLEDTRKEAEEWCRKIALDTKAAIHQLFEGKADTSLVDIERTFEKDFAEATKAATKSPFEMGGAGNMFLLYNIAEFIKAKSVVETGVAYGWSSLSVLLSIAKRENSKLYSTDMPYAKMGNDDYVGIVVPEKYKAHWKLYRESDVSGLPKIVASADVLDMIHYDSDKSYVGRMYAYPLLYNKLRTGGVFISDDIQDNIAFKDFCDSLKITPTVISFEGKYVGVFIKK